MCFRCTRSSTCGTRCYSVTPLSPSVSAWPYCSSSGTVFWLMASTSASYSSLTFQVRICLLPPKPEPMGVHPYEQSSFSLGFVLSLRLQMCADVSELMISSNQAALYSYTRSFPWCALGMPQSALHLSNSQHLHCGSRLTHKSQRLWFPSIPITCISSSFQSLMSMGDCVAAPVQYHSSQSCSAFKCEVRLFQLWVTKVLSCNTLMMWSMPITKASG